MIQFDMSLRLTSNILERRQIALRQLMEERRGILGPRVRAQLRIPDHVKMFASKNSWMTTDGMIKLH